MGLKEIRKILDGLDVLQKAGDAVTAVHDELCDPSEFLVPGESPLKDDVLCIKDRLHMLLGEQLTGMGLSFRDGTGSTLLEFDGKQALKDIESPVSRASVMEADDPVGELVKRYNTQRRTIDSMQTAAQNQTDLKELRDTLKNALNQIKSQQTRSQAWALQDPMRYVVDVLNATAKELDELKAKVKRASDDGYVL